MFVKRLGPDPHTDERLCAGLYRCPDVWELANHPYGVACLAGHQPKAEGYNKMVLQAFEEFLALELKSRRNDLTNRLYASLQNLFIHEGQGGQGICDAISRQLLEIINCQAVSIVLKPELNSASPVMHLVASQIAPGFVASDAFLQFQSGFKAEYPVNARSLTGFVALHSKPLIDNEVSQNDRNSFRFRELADRNNDTWLGVPILTATKECIGVLRCSGKMTTIHGTRLNYIFDNRDSELVKNAASILAPLLQHDYAREKLSSINADLETAETIREHEMRGPLQLIHSEADFVQRNLDDPSATSKERRLNGILTNVLLCGTLLTSTILPSPQAFRSELQKVDLAKLIQGLVDVLRHQIEARSPSQILEDPTSRQLVMTAQPFMIVEFQGSAPHLIAHRDLLQRAVYNIAANAIKYAKRTEKGRLTITLEQLPDSRQIRIHFRDQGIGVTEEEASQIMHGRYRGRERNMRPGVGLGLKIAKAIIELHKGTLALCNYREPTVFEILLPNNCIQVT